MILPPIIGITGKAGVGKDILADYLVKKYEYTRYGFADPIKELLNKRFGWKPEQWMDRKWKEAFQITNDDSNGGYWSYSPREMAQWLGTEVGRETFGEDCWVELFERLYRKVNDYRAPELCMPFVIPDVRFANEADKIRELGGRIIHLFRDGVMAVAAHVSEKGVLAAKGDTPIFNDRSIEALQVQVDEYLRSL